MQQQPQFLFTSTASGKVNFDGFSAIAGHFLEEEDAEAMQQVISLYRFISRSKLYNNGVVTLLLTVQQYNLPISIDISNLT